MMITRIVGSLAMLAAGVVLIRVHLRWRRRTPAPQRRGTWAYLWHLLRSLPELVVFAAWMLAPRHVLPGQRIPRPRARRMVQAMNADQARRKIG